jgi:hypothetical protein
MRTTLRMDTIVALLLSVSGQSVPATQPVSPAPSPVILEATNIIHGVGHYVGKTLLIRLRADGTVEWETNLDSYNAKSIF